MTPPHFSMQDILTVLGIKEVERGYFEAELTKAQARIAALEAEIAELVAKKVQ